MCTQRLLVVSLAVAAVACTTTDPTPPAQDPCAANATTGIRTASGSGLALWTVAPRSTDACITTRLDSHVVFRSQAGATVGRLFVFLPGTGAIAQNYQLVTREAAAAGYHAVALTYPNESAVGVLCAGRATTCYADTRLEILTGEPLSDVVTVDRANSIENRLLKLVRLMATLDPSGGWSQYVTSAGEIVWSRVAVAGHSQGGGHALFIAKRYVVARATAFASYGDVLPGGGAAPWVALPFATPSSQLRGFISLSDELVSATQALQVWSALGMSGAAANVDSVAPPFGAAQRFITTAAPDRPDLATGPHHNVVVVDVNTPKLPGGTSPAFGQVWRAIALP